jgi:hypothetical protein
LSTPIRSWFEQRLGADLSTVRLHLGPSADAAARSIGAQAFAMGEHVGFARDAYRPGEAQGRRLIAHELAHVLQVREGAPADALRLERGDREAAASVPAAPSTPGSVMLHGMRFATDSEGRAVLTGAILMEEMRRVYRQILSRLDRDADLSEVRAQMAVLDTRFYSISQNERQRDTVFYFYGSEYSAEEVNYIGVGLGFQHFNLLREWLSTGDVHTIIVLWNLTQHGDLSKPGEHLFARLGMASYASIASTGASSSGD